MLAVTALAFFAWMRKSKSKSDKALINEKCYQILKSEKDESMKRNDEGNQGQNATENKETTKALAMVLITAALMMASGSAFAQEELGDGVCAFVNMLTGKWLFGLTLLAIIGTGSAQLFGIEMSETLKKISAIILTVSLILAGSSILAFAFKSFNGMSC